MLSSLTVPLGQLHTGRESVLLFQYRLEHGRHSMPPQGLQSSLFYTFLRTKHLAGASSGCSEQQGGDMRAERYSRQKEVTGLVPAQLRKAQSPGPLAATRGKKCSMVFRASLLIEFQVQQKGMICS